MTITDGGAGESTVVGLSDRVVLDGSKDSPSATYLLTKCPAVALKPLSATPAQSQPSSAQAGYATKP